MEATACRPFPRPEAAEVVVEVREPRRDGCGVSGDDSVDW